MFEISIYIIVVILIILVLILFYNIVFMTIENFYVSLFGKPIFIHFYPIKKSLTYSQVLLLESQFQFYRKLSDKEKMYFEHRVFKFITKFEFIGREKFEITDEVKVLIAATSVMLTFGMRNYLYKVIDKIIVYPSIYFSNSSNDYHKGEFNPMMRAIVFSWEDFLAGYDISNDNLNLGIHEFTHVLHFQSLKIDDVSSNIFSKNFNDIRNQIHFPANRKSLFDSNYFRSYAYTNDFEFLAVLIEHYFETPEEFKIKFPALYKKVGSMLNYEI